MSDNAFTAQGKTILVTAAATAPTGVQCVGAGNNICTTYLLENVGLELAYVAAGATAAAAQSAAVVPTATSQKVYVLQPGIFKIVRDLPAADWSGITLNASAKIHVTPGEGK